jgi:phosphoglycolate phosphatase-like HAD superfamily hydrolase
MKAVVFDFDGVIHDTFDFHLKNVRQVFGEHIPEHVHRNMSNLVMPESTRNFLLDLTKRYELFIISSGSTAIITDYLNNNRIYSAFTEILGLDGHGSKVEKFERVFRDHDVRADLCVFVTDTLGDIMEAREVGVRTIAIDTGYHDRDTLLKGSPHHIISRLEELHQVLESPDR